MAKSMNEIRRKVVIEGYEKLTRRGMSNDLAFLERVLGDHHRESRTGHGS